MSSERDPIMEYGATLDLPASDRVASAGAYDPGQVIGHFVIRAKLGEGGMGVVFAGVDADLGRPVAIKLVKASGNDGPYRARLLREAQVMARLEHPNIVRVYEVGSDRDRLFVAMELVDGVDLGTWLKVERRPWRDVVAMFAQAGRGLAAVHRAGLVHRDFKPANVLVDRDGHARVADFGLARMDPDRGSSTSNNLAASLTHTGMMVGTPAYMAPEQLAGAVDPRSDQYSFCVALRESLIGFRPPKIEDAHWKDVPRAVRDAINRGASIDVNDRWPSMDALLDALAPSRRRVVLGVAGASLVVAGGIVAVVLLMNREQETSKAPVLAEGPRPNPYIVHVDAGLVAKQVDAAPVDKTVVPVDAHVVVETNPPKPPGPRPRVAEKPAKGTTTVGGTVITPMAPLAETDAAKKHNLEGDKPKLYEMVAAHRAAVRDAIRDFGYGSVTMTAGDHDADIAEVQAKIDASTEDLEKAIFLNALGHAERFYGNCIAAAKAWAEGKKLAIDSTRGQVDQKRRTQAFKHYGRMVVGEGFCDLTNGRALGVSAKLLNGAQNLFGASDTERAEVWFAMGIALFETGDIEEAKRLLQQAANRGSDKLRAAINVYAGAVGMKL